MMVFAEYEDDVLNDGQAAFQYQSLIDMNRFQRFLQAAEQKAKEEKLAKKS